MIPTTYVYTHTYIIQYLLFITITIIIDSDYTWFIHCDRDPVDHYLWVFALRPWFTTINIMYYSESKLHITFDRYW